VGLANFRYLFDPENWAVRGYFGNALRNSVLFVIGFGPDRPGRVGVGHRLGLPPTPGPAAGGLYTLVILA